MLAFGWPPQHPPLSRQGDGVTFTHLFDKGFLDAPIGFVDTALPVFPQLLTEHTNEQTLTKTAKCRQDGQGGEGWVGDPDTTQGHTRQKNSMWGSPSGKGYMQKEVSRISICHALTGRPLYLGSH